MAQKQCVEGHILLLIRDAEVHCRNGMDVVSACRATGVSDKSYCGWHRKHDRMNRARLSKTKNPEKDNQRLKKIAAELRLDKLILKESCNYLKPKAWAYWITAARLFIPAKNPVFRNAEPLQ